MYMIRKQIEKTSPNARKNGSGLYLDDTRCKLSMGSVSQETTRIDAISLPTWPRSKRTKQPPHSSCE